MPVVLNVPGREGAVKLITVPSDMLSRIQKFLVDGVYSGEKFANNVRERSRVEVRKCLRPDPHTQGNQKGKTTSKRQKYRIYQARKLGSKIAPRKFKN